MERMFIKPAPFAKGPSCVAKAHPHRYHAQRNCNHCENDFHVAAKAAAQWPDDVTVYGIYIADLERKTR